MNEQPYKKIKCYIWLPAQTNISNVFTDKWAVDIFRDNIILEEKEIKKIEEEDEETKLDSPAYKRQGKRIRKIKQ